MYHYYEDQGFLSRMRAEAGSIMQELCHQLKDDHDIGATFYLVGSGAKKLVTQNASNPIDLDYNLEILRCEDFDDCRALKEAVGKSFNKVLARHRWYQAQDHTSVFKARRIYAMIGQPQFSIDVCITMRDRNDRYYRLIHEKTGFTCYDRYFWNEAPHSARLREKADYIKKHGKWHLVREQYLNIKNRYLTRNDHDHPSFVCYVEAVSNVYNGRRHW